MTTFEGFGPKVRPWFKGLEADNSREYFSSNRDFFEAAIREQMESLLGELAVEFGGGDVRMFRQNRDIRFSADKSPYKTNTYGVVLGTGIADRGLYASISAGGLVAGSGYHLMARDQLERYRQSVADDGLGPELAKLVADARRARIELWGGSLATAPRGYPRDHERIELLRRTSLVARRHDAAWPQRHRPRRRAPLRRGNVACRRARDGLARPARRRERAAGRPPPRTALTPAAPRPARAACAGYGPA